MQNNLTTSQAKDMAHKLMGMRELLASGNLADMYEAVAKLNGARNWDAYAAELAKTDTSVNSRLSRGDLPAGAFLQVDKPFVVAFDTRTEELHEGPAFGFMVVDQQLMDRVLSARQHLLANDFKQVTLGCYLANVQVSFARSSYFRMENEEVVVDAQAMRIRGVPKYDTAYVRGAWLEYSLLQQALLCQGDVNATLPSALWLNEHLLLVVDDLNMFGFTDNEQHRRKLVVDGLLEGINPEDEDIEDISLFSEDCLFGQALKPLLPSSATVAAD